MNKVDKYTVDLNEVLAEYCQTKDKSLITKEVYDAITAFTINIAKPFMVNNYKYRDYDEVMSVCNVALMAALETYDKDKSKISTYIAICMRNAILMDIRRDKKHKRCVRSLDEVVACDSIKENSEITLGELIEDVKASDFTNYDSDAEMIKLINDAVTSLKEKNKLNDRMYEVTIMYMSGKTQYTISKELGISQSYVSRILRKSREVIIKYLERNDISTRHRPVRKG